jgi:hypothetical protein
VDTENENGPNAAAQNQSDAWNFKEKSVIDGDVTASHAVCGAAGVLFSSESIPSCYCVQLSPAL